MVQQTRTHLVSIRKCKLDEGYESEDSKSSQRKRH